MALKSDGNTLLQEVSSCSSTLRGDDLESAREPYANVPQAEVRDTRDHHASLPPKKLERYTIYQLRKRHVEPWLVCSILAIVAPVLFVVLVASPHFVDESTSRSTKRVACPNFEDSSIHVNIHVLEGLSFTEAKYIDLIWDTGIGQVIFDPVAVKSLWSCLRILLAKKPVPTTVMVIGIFFAISHVLAFATIWSAATGYEFDTATAYAITDTDSFISMASGQLTLCWSVPDWDRVQKGVGNKIIIGPTIEQIYGGNWEKIGSRLEFNEDSIIQEASGDFKNIYAYALAKATFFNRYNTSWTSDLTQWTYVSGNSSWFINGCDISGNETVTGYQFNNTCISTNLSSSVDGWQYTGTGQDRNGTTSSQSTTQTRSTNDQASFYPLNSEFHSYKATFLLDAEVTSGTSVVPYNSTLWWNGTEIKMDAPFLDIGSNCRWSYGNLDVCLCLKGSVLEQDFRSNQRTCLNDAGYNWGFSLPLVVVGLGLEIAWVLLCSLMWFIAMSESELVKHHRPGSGFVRAIIDISRAIDISLGSDTGAYTDKELTKELEKCHPVGYSLVEHEQPTKPLIRLIPMPGGMRMRPQIRIDKKTLYR